MEWMAALRSTLRYVEEHLCEPVDIAEIAKELYMSPYYLQKGFQIMTGYSIGEYIRNRRLYEAARELTEGDGKIIDIAFRYGYETPESFTKAFARFHGVTPSALRKEPQKIRLFLPLSLKIEITGGDKMNYVVSPMWGFKVIGFEREFSYEDAYRRIPEFWNEICEKYCTHTIYAGKAPSCPQEQAIMDNCIGEYGVCIDDVGNGRFRYLIAGRYTGGEVPDGMTLFEFPQGEWAKFEAVGPIPDALQALNTKVFKEWLPGNPDYEMAGFYNLEWYSPDGEQSDPDYKSGIWVPVRRYREEAEKRYGDTKAYHEYQKKSQKRTAEEEKAISDGLMALFARFGAVRETGESSPETQALVEELKQYISTWYYTCDNGILASLGEMYVGDDRFRTNIDRTAGAGTAQFVSDAIRIFVK